jgi:transcriptional regulator with XRE-family HTH domain
MPYRSSSPSLRHILAANVRALRESRGWSQEHLAEKSGLTQVYISQIETSKTAASVDTLEKLASGFGHSADRLLRGTVPSD